MKGNLILEEKFDWKGKLGIALLLCIGQMLLQKIALDTGNLTIHIPLIRFFEGKALFAGDPIQLSLISFISFFYRFIAFLHISDSMIRPFFAASYFIFETAIFYVLFLIWEKIGFSKKISIWAGVIIAIGYLPSLGASAWWGVFTHQMPAMLFISIAFYFLLDEKAIISAIFLGIAFDIHLIFAFPAIVIWTIVLLYNRKWKEFIIGAIFISFFSIPILVWLSKLNLLQNYEVTMKLFNIRSSSEMFPLKLGIIWLPFSVFTTIVLFQIRKKWSSIKKWALPVIISTTIFILVAIFGELSKNISVIRMQTLRGTVFFVLMFFPFFIEYIFEQFQKNLPSLFCFFPAIGMQPPIAHISMLFPMIVRKKSTLWFLGIFWLLVGFVGPILVWKGFTPAEQVKDIVLVDFKLYMRFQILVLIFGVGLILKIDRKIKLFPIYALLIIAIFRSIVGGPFTVQDKQWVDIQKWAVKNTSADAIFLTPPEIDGFRVYSMRSIVFDWKSGPGVDLEWWKRLQDFHPKSYTSDALGDSYRKMSINEKITIAKKYNARYIVVSNLNDFTGEPVYSNNKWSIYEPR
ncbi:hypothetical protein J7L68_09730 [bacterium]|nr:hypothetical protein [bacterium]